MCDYTMGIEPPLESQVPCCTYLRAFVRSKDYNYITDLCKQLSITKNWRCVYRGFPPYWELYIAKEDLSTEELEKLKCKVLAAEIIRS
jgi:hypothetical protein